MISIKQVEYNSPEYHATWQIREETLRTPLGMTLKDEDLSHEAHEKIYAAYDGDKIVGTVILHVLNDNELQLKQLAVSPNQQGKKIGNKLALFCEEFGRENGFSKIILHARSAVKPFYDKLGYTNISEEHLRIGIPHFTMEKKI